MSHGRAREATDDGKVRVGRPPQVWRTPRYEAAAGMQRQLSKAVEASEAAEPASEAAEARGRRRARLVRRGQRRARLVRRRGGEGNEMGRNRRLHRVLPHDLEIRTKKTDKVRRRWVREKKRGSRERPWVGSGR